MFVHPLVIIGSGPAGYTAAIYAARAELQPVLFEGSQPGGQLMLTTEVENFPGFPHGMMGPEMMEQFRQQAERFHTTIISEQVISVDFSVRPFVLKTSTQSVQARAVIISTGASAMWLGIPGEKTFQGKGVSACATCDGFFFKGKEILVVGGGDTAMEESLFLTKFASKVTVVVRRDALRASKIMQERVRKNEKISFLWNTEVQEVVGEEKMSGAVLWNNKTHQTTTFSAEGLFLAIGHKPNTEIFKGQIDLDEKDYIVCRPGSTKTNIEGIFAAGDVADHVYRQAVTAAGTGCMAALDAERWLAAQE